MKPRKAVLLSIVALAVAAGFLSLPGCDSAALIRPRVDNVYRVEAALIRDQGHDTANALVGLLRNDEVAADVTVVVGTDTLVFDSLTYPWNVYALAFGPADSLPLGATLLMFDDDVEFEDTFAVVVPGTPAITSIVPQLKGPADQVRVSWAGAVNSEGYILAAVKQDSAYEGIGWSQFVAGGLTSETINDSAFTRTTLQGAEPDPGTYLIYVYAFTGAPDSALSAGLLPVPFPAQLADNIDETDVKGRFGVIAVSIADTVEVLAAP